uniref:Uncharacterized protein n=1 Tax=Oryza glumipatula TaxID=40148 RepID=A0A0D9Y464_9ORYZ
MGRTSSPAWGKDELAGIGKDELAGGGRDELAGVGEDELTGDQIRAGKRREMDELTTDVFGWTKCYGTKKIRT